MPRINDQELFPISPIVPGSTWIGSLPDGTTVQYSSEELEIFIDERAGIIYADKAKKVGDVVIGNLVDRVASQNPNINNGGTYIAEVLVFPFTEPEHLKFIHRIA